MFYLLKKRTYDISVITDKSVKVKFNGEIIKLKSFENYINMYIGKHESIVTSSIQESILSLGSRAID